MVAHKVGVGDSTSTEDAIGGAPVDSTPARKPYLVIAEGGLFKNGKTYKHGQKVELDEVTAERAIAAGDVEEL